MPWKRRVSDPEMVPVAYPPSPLVTSHSLQTRDWRPSSVGGHASVLTRSAFACSITAIYLLRMRRLQYDCRTSRDVPAAPADDVGRPLAAVVRMLARPVQVPRGVA